MTPRMVLLCSTAWMAMTAWEREERGTSVRADRENRLQRRHLRLGRLRGAVEELRRQRDALVFDHLVARGLCGRGR